MATHAMSGRGLAQSVRTDVHESWDECEEIEEEWKRLAVNCGNAFVTPEWFRAARVDKPLVVSVRDTNETVLGVLPLAFGSWRSSSVARPAAPTMIDCFHPLVASNTDRREVTTALFSKALEVSPNAVVADRLRDSDLRTLEEGLECDVAKIGLGGAELPYIGLSSCTWDDYLAAKSRNFRQQVRRLEKKLREAHTVSVTETESASMLDRDFAAFFRLHDARRSRVGGSSLDDPHKREILRDFAALALQNGWLRLRLLSADGEPVAGFYGWSIGPSYSFYQSGFNPEWSELRVGWVSLILAIQQACDEGAERFDLLLGDEDYKKRFATGTRWVETAVLAPRWSRTTTVARGERRARIIRRQFRNARSA